MRKAIPVYAVDRNAKKTATEVTKLWSLNSRYQIITLRTTRWLLNDVDKVQIEWTLSRNRRGSGSLQGATNVMTLVIPRCHAGVLTFQEMWNQRLSREGVHDSGLNLYSMQERWVENGAAPYGFQQVYGQMGCCPTGTQTRRKIELTQLSYICIVSLGRSLYGVRAPHHVIRIMRGSEGEIDLLPFKDDVY